MFIYPYKMGSESASNLANALDCKQIKHVGSKFIGSPDKVVVNWGASQLPPEVLKCRVLNIPEAVAMAADKLVSFNAMLDGGVSIPDFSEDRNTALDWLEVGHIVICRTKLNGHSGEGIVIAETAEQLVDAPLYVKYIPKKEEYRVHYSKITGVMFIQRKARRKDVPAEQINWRIRNHDNGFIFAAHEGLGLVPEDVANEARRAVECLGLDFGAVDVIHNAKSNRSYVLEVNTAPGITGDSVFQYTSMVQDWVHNIMAKKKGFKLADIVANPVPAAMFFADPIPQMRR